MHGTINCALQSFIIETFGRDVWAEVRTIADLRFEDFEAMLRYDDALTVAVFTAAANAMHQAETAVLEDLGTFLITHPPLAPLRRLLRFGGGSFTEFVLSLDELPERGRMAMPEVELPEIAVIQIEVGHYHLRAHWKLPGIGGILLGALRAMADDYGSLATLSFLGVDGNEECLEIRIHDTNHRIVQDFVLAEASP